MAPACRNDTRSNSNSSRSRRSERVKTTTTIANAADVISSAVGMGQKLPRELPGRDDHAGQPSRRWLMASSHDELSLR